MSTAAIILLICGVTVAVSYFLFLIAALMFLGGNKEEDISEEGGCYLAVTVVAMFIPIWNIIRMISFVRDPAKHLKPNK